MELINKYIHSDCLDIVKTLSDDSIDHLITDFPYSDKTHEGARTNKGNGKVKELVDFKFVSSKFIIDFYNLMQYKIKRWLIAFMDWHVVKKLEDYEFNNLDFIRFGIWNKQHTGAPQFSGDRPATGWEAICIMHRKGRKVWNGGGKDSVFDCNIVHGKHSTQKPLKLMTQLIKLFTDENDLIIDPFAGVFTTGIAALKLKRRYILIEKDKKFYDDGKERLERVKKLQPKSIRDFV